MANKKALEKPRVDLRVVYLLFGLLALFDISCLIWYGINAYVTTRPIELSGSIECNTGNIGIDFQSYYNTTLQKNRIVLLNETYNYNERVGWTPTQFNLKGINNLYCKAQFNSKNQISDVASIIKQLYELNQNEK